SGLLFYKKANCLFVSNINGKAGDKDGNGSIAKLSLDGNIINANWVSGLNAPKGMGIYKNKLYVTDLNEVVVIDISKSAIVDRIVVDNAKFLNDLTISNEGTIFISDSRSGKVHSIENGVVSTYIDSLKGPNGLLAVDGYLYVLDRGTLFQYKNSQQIAKIADGFDASTDGVEKIGLNEFIISCWSGIIYYINEFGNKQVLLDKRNEKINSADIGINLKQNMIYVPTFNSNKVVAYEFKKMRTMLNSRVSN
ncbi:MAG: YncE family protein, partial [Chitinophagaceae bacterium]